MTSYEPTTPTSFHQGNPPPPIAFIPLLKSWDEIFFKGGRAVTPRIMKTLKKVINK
jgi:hypothetical protein